MLKTATVSNGDRFIVRSSDFGLVGDSPQIQLVLELIRKLKHDVSPVLITGESGVGKELGVCPAEKPKKYWNV